MLWSGCSRERTCSCRTSRPVPPNGWGAMGGRAAGGCRASLGAAERLGVDARSACARYPRLIGVDISGYGSGGPRADARAYDLLVQSEARACAITGTGDQPAKPGIAVADIGTGMTAANAVLAALFARAKSGAGTAISIAMFDVVTDWMSWALHQARATGTNPPRLGVGSPVVAPYGAY